MKKNIFLFWVLLSTLVGGVSCRSEELPANPTIVSPVSSLVLSVEGMDYVAVPRLKEDKTLDNVLTLEVRKASTKAVVKSIVLADASAEANVAVGDEVTFTGNRWELVLKRGMETGSYFVEMVYNEPPFMYFVKTGDYGPEGERYYVNPDKSQKIASINYDTKFEGYIDLTGTNWDNIGLVASDLSSYYDFSGGADGSSCSFEMVKKESAGGNVFACDGPWGNWTSNNGTPEITSPGVWKINFDAATQVMTLLHTQWAVTGSAISSLKAMTYSSETRLWSLDTDLSPGTLKFTTIAVGYGDPIIVYVPLIAVNCAIMGASLFMQQRITLGESDPKFIGGIADAVSYALGSGIGWLLAIVGLAAIREKMAYSDVPAPLKGLGITFITVGLMAMAFMCFSGLNI